MAELLRVDGLSAGHGEAQVLFGVNFELAEGRSIALLGRNGVGKTTLINTLVGVTQQFGGRITLAGRDVTHEPPEARVAAGIGWVPQERNVFKSLTVVENMTVVARPGPWTPKRVFEVFPRLAERKKNLGAHLSGGEQQMLAIGRALVLNPKVMLLDEPTEGLAPVVVQELMAALSRLVQDAGMSSIIVEQRVRKVLKLTDHTVILNRGTVAYSGPSADLLADVSILERHMSLAGGTSHSQPASES